jgi:alpha/beta superfamily hydrolase
VDDVLSALQWLHREYALPIIFAGFSFGAAVGMRAACSDSGVVALASIGTPVAAVDERGHYDFSFLLHCKRPKLFLSGSEDKFGPRQELEAVVNQASPPKSLVLIQGADHFFTGHLQEYREAIERWLHDVLNAAPPQT